VNSEFINYILIHSLNLGAVRFEWDVEVDGVKIFRTSM